MTRNELYQILRNYVGRDAEALHAVKEIWGKAFEGETEKIKPDAEKSSLIDDDYEPDWMLVQPTYWMPLPQPHQPQ